MFGQATIGRRLAAASLALVVPAILTACNDDPLFELAPDAPTNVVVAVQNQDIVVTWTPGNGATSQRVEVAAVGGGDDYVEIIGDGTTSTATFEDVTPASYTAIVYAINGSGEAPSTPYSFTVLPPVTAPTLDSFGAVDGDRTSLEVTWTPATTAENWYVELVPDGGDVIDDVFPSSATSAVFGPPVYVILDGVTYTAKVCPVSAGAVVEEDCSATATFTANTHDWDTYLPTSLHASGAGMGTFYYASNGGFERYTGVPYDQLSCQNCHASIAAGECETCHVGDPDPQIGATVDNAVCSGCHSRQGSEVSLGFGDVHRDAGMVCMDCHSLEDVHGDGNVYASQLEDGAIDAKCENCHNADDQPGFDPAHAGAAHGDLDCSSCHMATVTTCYNCHFETELDFDRKVFYGPPPFPGPAAGGNSWVFLGNRVYGDGSTKVHPMNMQTLKFGTVADGDEVGFVTIAPYYAHTIMPAEDARGVPGTCGLCHANFGPENTAIAEYNATGLVTVAEWDDVNGGFIRPHNGIVPIPADYLTSLYFEFADLVDPDNPPASGSDPADWQFLKAGADTIQILEQYGAPLTEGQMGSLGMTGP